MAITRKSSRPARRARSEAPSPEKTNTRRSAARRPSRSAPQQTTATAALSEDQKRQMVAEAAYYRAEKRGFGPGNTVNDWLEAEQEVAEHLQRPSL